MYRVKLTPKAQKQILKLDPPVAKRIKAFLEGRLDNCINPRAFGTKLIDQEFWRYRVGDYRILVQISDGELLVLVVDLAHRREIYRDL